MREKDGRSDPVHQGVGRRVLFTGPDGVGNHRVKPCDFPHSIGIGALSLEATGDLNYLFRAAPNTPSPLPKNCHVGGVGWGIEHGFSLNARTLLSNTQIKRSEFRSAMEDRISQIFQHSWQAPPCRQEPRTQVHQSADEKHRQDSNNQILLSKRWSRKTAEKTHQSHFRLPAIARKNSYLQ